MASVIRVVLAAYSLFFAASALGKVDGWRSWTATLPRLLSFPPTLIRLLSVAMPASEAAVSVTLLLNPRAGLLAAGCLLVLLAIAAGALSLRHRGEQCMCFGSIADSRIGLGLLSRNLALSVGAFSTGLIVVNPKAQLIFPIGELGTLLLVTLAWWLVVEYRRMRTVAVRR